MSEFDYKQIDDVIHSRVRLSIMAYLTGAKRADFSDIRKKVGVSDGNLSVHLTKLEKAGFIDLEKSFQGRKPLTTVHLTGRGEKAFQNYVGGLAKMLGQRL